MRYLFFLYLLFIVSTAGAQTPNPFLSLRYDSLVFYDYDGYKGNSRIIDEQGNLNKTVIKSKVADAATAKEFSRLLGLRSSYGQAQMECFHPHLGLVYYKEGKPGASVLVCLECNRVGGGLGDLGTAAGMSKSFRKYINTLLKQYHFSHQIVPGSYVD